MLNGTTTTGLAHLVSGELRQSGYSRAPPLNGRPPGANQVTVVEYTRGHRADAEGVARSLVVTRCSRSKRPSASLAGSATVVVIVGSRQGCDRPIAGFLDIPERSAKPRERGLTHVIDRGLSVAEVDGLLEVAGDSVDVVKLGWGTALVSANLRPSSSATPRTGSRWFSAARSPSWRSARAGSRG